MTDVIAALPHAIAALNLSAATLLVAGRRQIRAGREQAHRKIMIATMAVSAAFLVCYLTHAAFGEATRFPTDAPTGDRYFYLTVLASHTVLAAVTPILALTALWLGLKGRREQHRRIARWTFPIWMYVSVTGVVVYVMLRWIYA